MKLCGQVLLKNSYSCLSAAAQSTEPEQLTVVLLTVLANPDETNSPAINELSNPGAIGQHSFRITLQMLVSCRVYKVPAEYGEERTHNTTEV